MRRLRSWLFFIFAAASFCVSATSAFALYFDTVIIDPGHGGQDRGGIPIQRVSEKSVNLDTALRLEKLLRSVGFKTVMTRRGDYFITLEQRCRIANRYRNAIFVSIHYNSAEREGAHGYESYYFQSNAAPLASKIQRRMLQVQPTENRGVKRRGFYVLRHTQIPAVLIECGFLTNRREARLASTPQYRQRIATAIAQGIIDERKGRR